MGAKERILASRLLAQLVLMVALIVALPAAGYAHGGHDHSGVANSVSPSMHASVAVKLTIAEQQIAKSYQFSPTLYDGAATSSFKHLKSAHPVLTVSAARQDPCAGCCAQGGCCSGSGSCCPQSVMTPVSELYVPVTSERLFLHHDAVVGALFLNGLERPPKT